MCVPLSTPRLPVASYKNSFSMTEWRIRLEGNDQSSGTPFKDTLLPLPLSVCPLWGVHWAVFPLLHSHCNRKKKKKSWILMLGMMALMGGGVHSQTKCHVCILSSIQLWVSRTLLGKSRVYLTLVWWSTVIEVTVWMFQQKEVKEILNIKTESVQRPSA